MFYSHDPNYKTLSYYALQSGFWSYTDIYLISAAMLLSRRYHAELRAVRQRAITYESFSVMISTLMRLRRDTIASSSSGEEEDDIVLQASVIEDWLDSLNAGLYALVQEVYRKELQQGSIIDIQKVLVEEVEANLKVSG